MLSGLMLTAFLMGIAGAPHCAAMCGTACAAMLPRGLPWSALAGRCAGYAVLGAVVATSSGLAAQLARHVSFLQPLWILAQALALLLGFMLLWTGAMPKQLDAVGRDVYRAMKARFSALSSNVGSSHGTAARAALPLIAGMGWAMLPCGLLYAALVVAALAPDGLGGACVMLAFGIPSAMGVWAAPAVLRWVARDGQSRVGNTVSMQRAEPAFAANAGALPGISPILWLKQEPLTATPSGGACAEQSGAAVLPNRALIDPRWAVRLAGFMLALMSAWALYHQVATQWRAWCA